MRLYKKEGGCIGVVGGCGCRYHPLIQKSPVQFQARSHTGIMVYDEACLMHLYVGFSNRHGFRNQTRYYL